MNPLQPVVPMGSPPSRNCRLKPYADPLLAGIVALLAFGLYLRTLAPGVLAGDSGEFQFAAWLGGLVHPTGYPLYLMLGYLWDHLLPLGTPAWRLNLFSAFWAALAAGLLYLLALSLLRLAGPAHATGMARRSAALLAAGLFAVGPTFWSQAVIAEVYSLNAAFVVAVLLGLCTWAEQPEGRRSYRRLYLTAAALGLGMTHHRTLILLAPAIVLFLFAARRSDEPWPVRLSGLARALPLLVLPLLLYLYVPLRAPHTPYAHLPLGANETLDLFQPTFSGFVEYVAGSAFSPEIRTVPGAVAQVVPAAQLLLNEFTWVGVALGMAGLWLLARASNRLPFILTGTAFLALVVFNLFYGIGDIYVFYVPAFLLWSLWAAGGVMAAGGLLRRTMQQNSGLLFLLPALLSLALPAWLLAARYGQVDQSHNLQVAQAWLEILGQPLPQQAILASNDRDEMTPLFYYQYVEGRRPDLTGLFPLIGPAAQWGDIGQVLDAALRTQRPVLLIKPMPGLEVKFRTEPAGKLVQVIGPSAARAPERARSVSFGSKLRLAGYDAQPLQVKGGGTLTIHLYWQPQESLAADYTTFVHVLNADGDSIGGSDHRPGGVYYPSSLWRPGELLRDDHTMTLSAQPGRPPYTILVGLYRQTDQLEHLGKPEQIGLLGLLRPPDRLPGNLNALGYTLGGQLALDGYEMSLKGARLTLRLYWQAVVPPAADYTLFVHVLDSSDNIVAQRDQQPAGGQVPTTTWPAGYVLADEVVIDLPADLAAGQYSLAAGAYQAAAGPSLPVLDAAGHAAGPTAPLGTFRWPVAKEGAAG